MGKWTAKDLPDLHGKVAIVTGANSGLGFHTTLGLAGSGAKVVMACRDARKTEAAIKDIKAEVPAASLEFMALDLSDLSSVRAFAGAYLQKYSRLDILCNNAGVMALPYLKTKDGFEMQIGTNHLGHFALTGLLLDVIKRAPGARIVNVSSEFHRGGKIRFDDLNWETGYSKWAAYRQSKIANLLFTYELQRRLEKAGVAAMSVASHPGYAATNLQSAGPALEDSGFGKLMMAVSNTLFAQPADMGALPSLYAAGAPGVKGGEYYGPDGFMHIRGYPARGRSNSASHDTAVASQLWGLSQKLTGVSYLS